MVSETVGAQALASDGSEVDAVVVGGGPAGLAAALWLGRYRRSVVVLDSQDYRSASVERSHGYLGRDPQTPLDLLARGRQELLAYPTAAIRPAVVSSITRRPDRRFDVRLDDGSLVAHRVVLATGVRDVVPVVRGFDEHYGASVFHCPACDGYEARDRDVVALGWDAHLVGFAATLLNWARSVTVVTDGRRFAGDETCRSVLADNGIALLEQDAVEFVGTVVRSRLCCSATAGACRRRWRSSPWRTSRRCPLPRRWGAPSTTTATSRWTGREPPPSTASTPPATSPPGCSWCRSRPPRVWSPASVQPSRSSVRRGPPPHLSLRRTRRWTARTADPPRGGQQTAPPPANG
jgi:hypothetical protein